MTDELSHSYDIELTETEIKQAIAASIPAMRPTIFQKALPEMSFLRKKFGDEVMTHIVQMALQSRIGKLTEALGANVDVADIQVTGKWNMWDRPLRYKYNIAIEVFPQFVVQGLDNLSYPVIVPVKISDAEVDSFLDVLRRERSPWISVKRECMQGDRLVVNFEATIKGEPFPGCRGEAVRVELGNNSLLPAFETALLGHVAGDKVTFSVDFPADYGTPALVGQTADFEMKIFDVQAIDLLPLDDAFAHRFGLADLAALRANQRAHIEAQHLEHDQRDISNHLIGQLLEANYIPLPNTVVNQHLLQIHADVSATTGQPIEKIQITENMIVVARRRAHMAIVVRQLVKDQKILADPDLVDRRVEAMAVNSEKPDFVRTNPEVRVQIQNEILQERVIEWLITRARQNATAPS